MFMLRCRAGVAYRADTAHLTFKITALIRQAELPPVVEAGIKGFSPRFFISDCDSRSSPNNCCETLGNIDPQN